MIPHDWRKVEKSFYLPKKKPEIIDVPKLKFFSIYGEGNPNSDGFPDYIQALYSLSYAIKMSDKKGLEPVGFYPYKVYPLEGVWSITDEAKETFTGTINKDDLVFDLMIRQPEFVDEDYALETIDRTKEKKGLPLLDKVEFKEFSEGLCVQMMHLGSYDDEPATFEIMEKFAEENNLNRVSKIHREIYLSDARKVAPEKLKTVLRFQVEKV